MFLSIIVPVYNTEKYLYGCLSSIFSQKSCSVEDYEVIIVIDGSPDNSISIAKEFEKKYENCRVVEQENLGLSQARNTGLNLARGKYVWFVDSDDKIDSSNFLKILDILKSSDIDIHVFDITIVFEDGSRSWKKDSIIYSNDKNRMLYNRCLTREMTVAKVQLSFTQRFILRNEFLKKHEMFFYPGIIHEDNEFMVRAFFFAERIFLHDFSSYLYLQRLSGSIMSNLDMRSLECRLKIIEILTSFKNVHAKTLSDKCFIYDNLLRQLFSLFAFKGNVSEKIYCDFIHSCKKYIRQTALRGILSEFYYRNFRNLMKGVLIFISPILYRIIYVAIKNIRQS